MMPKLTKQARLTSSKSRFDGNGAFKPVPAILVLAWPVVLEMMLHTFVWIFDTAMVMRLGAREASAVEYGAMILFGILNILGALGIAVNSLVARYTGAGNMPRAAQVGGQSLMLSLIISFIYMGLGLSLGKPFFSWIIKDPVTAALTVDYFYTNLFSGVSLCLPLLVAGGIIRGTGNTRVPMLVALIMNLYNVIGDYLLIFGHFGFPAMGVKGAALATGSAQLLGALLSLGYLFRHKLVLPFSLRSMLPLRLPVIRQVLKLSFPAGAEELTHSGSRLLTSTWITALGPIAFAANAAAVAAESFSFMPGMAFAIAATTLVGQRLGAGFPRQARDSGYWACALATALMSLAGILFLFFPYAIMSLFNPPEKEVLQLGVLCLQIAAVEQPFVAITMALSGALKGTGDTKSPFQIGLISNLFVRLPLIYAIVYLFHLEITYTWWATALQYAVSALLLLARYRRVKWHEMKALPASPGGCVVESRRLDAEA
jgi:putative MATE family efflux protein